MKTTWKICQTNNNEGCNLHGVNSLNLVIENTINKSFIKIWPTIKISKKPSSPATEEPSNNELIETIKKTRGEKCNSWRTDYSSSS